MAVASAREILVLGNLFGRDLAGWQLNFGYFLELQHGLLGNFPAILNREDGDESGKKVESDVIVFVLDKRLLRKVWERVDRVHAKVTSLLVLANPEACLAFNLRSDHPIEMKPLRLFSAGEIDALCLKANAFRWAPGLLGARDKDASPPSFDP